MHNYSKPRSLAENLQTNRKVKPKFYGEALTTDDVFQRFKEARALRKEIRAQRTTTSDRAHGKGKAKAK